MLHFRCCPLIDLPCFVVCPFMCCWCARCCFKAWRTHCLAVRLPTTCRRRLNQPMIWLSTPKKVALRVHPCAAPCLHCHIPRRWQRLKCLPLCLHPRCMHSRSPSSNPRLNDRPGSNPHFSMSWLQPLLAQLV